MMVPRVNDCSFVGDAVCTSFNIVSPRSPPFVPAEPSLTIGLRHLTGYNLRLLGTPPNSRMAPAVRCIILNTVPCNLRQAYSFVKNYADSDFLPSDGVTSSYVHTVAKALRQTIIRQRKNDLAHSQVSNVDRSHLRPSRTSLGSSGGGEQGMARKDRAGSGKHRREVVEDERGKQEANGMAGHLSQSTVVNDNIVGDVSQSKTVLWNDGGRSGSRTKRKGEKAVLDDGVAEETLTKETEGTPDGRAAKRLAREKVSTDQTVQDGHTPETVHRSRRKKRKQDEASTGV